MAEPFFLKPGDRIELISMPQNIVIPVGTQGTVLLVIDPVQGFPHNEHEIDVAWDDGTTAMLCIPPDVVKKLA